MERRGAVFILVFIRTTEYFVLLITASSRPPLSFQFGKLISALCFEQKIAELLLLLAIGQQSSSTDQQTNPTSHTNHPKTHKHLSPNNTAGNTASSCHAAALSLLLSQASNVSSALNAPNTSASSQTTDLLSQMLIQLGPLFSNGFTSPSPVTSSPAHPRLCSPSPAQSSTQPPQFPSLLHGMTNGASNSFQNLIHSSQLTSADCPTSGPSLRSTHSPSTHQTAGSRPQAIGALRMKSMSTGGSGALHCSSSRPVHRLNDSCANVWRGQRMQSANLIGNSKHTMPASWIDRSKLGPVAGQSK